MYSFYGGKEGRTYNIVAHYDSIYQMVLNFQQGGSHTDANYNEYVIIDTLVNKNKKHDRENGILYRRGLNFNEQFDPQGIIGGDSSHTLSENRTKSATLHGIPGKRYYDTDISDDDDIGSEEIVVIVNVPYYKHYDFIIHDSNTVDINPRDFIREDDRQEVTLYGIANTKYTDENPGTSGGSALAWTGLVPKYMHYTYYLHNEDNEVEAEIIPTKEKDDIPYSNFSIDWVNFVTNPGGGAIYIGQIVGPQGESPELQMVDWDTFDEEYLHGEYTDPNKGEIRTSRRPGFDTTIGYNDDIKYGWCNIKDVQGNVEGAVLAFDMPYTVFKADVHSVSAYGPTVETVTELPSEEPEDKSVYYRILRTDESGEYDYYIWDDTRTVNDDTVPSGYRYEPAFVRTDIWAVFKDEDGEWHYVDILREKADSQGHPYYKDYEFSIPKGIHGMDMKDLSVDSNYLLTYTEIDYDVYDDTKTPAEQEHGEIRTKILGTLKAIKNTEEIDVGPNGESISWIRINYYTIDPNTEDYEYDDIGIKRIDKIELQSNGQLVAYYVEGNGSTNKNIGILRSINNIRLNNKNQIEIVYNTVNQQGNPNVTTLGLQLRVVNEAGITNDIYNPSTGRYTKYLDKPRQFYYKYDVGIDGAAPETITITDPIDEIVDIKLYGDNIVILHSNKDTRLAINTAGRAIQMPYNGNTGWSSNQPDVSPNNFYWENLGPILNGEHIFGNYASLAALQAAYPTGFTGNYAGWVATVTEGSGSSQVTTLYAYDYVGSNGWYVISSAATNVIDNTTVIIVQKKSSSNPNFPISDTLRNYGCWFVVEE